MNNRIHSKVKPRGNGRHSADFRSRGLFIEDWMDSNPGYSVIGISCLVIAVLFAIFMK